MRENREHTIDTASTSGSNSFTQDNASPPLPEEIWLLHILPFIGLDDLSNHVVQVNTQLRPLANELIWKELFKPAFNEEYQKLFKAEFEKSQGGTAFIVIRNAMRQAAIKGDIDVIKYVVEKKLIDINAPLCREQSTLLYLAAEHQHHNLVKFLLDNQADPELPLARLIKEEAQFKKIARHQQSRERRLANQIAVPDGSFETWSFGYFHSSSLQRSHAPMIRILLSALEARGDELRSTQLTKEVVAQDRVDLLRRLLDLDRGIITRTDSSNHTLLYKAVTSRKGTTCAQYLLQKGAEINADVFRAAVLKSNSPQLVQEMLERAVATAADLVSAVMPQLPANSKMLSLLQPYAEQEQFEEQALGKRKSSKDFEKEKMAKKRKSPERQQNLEVRSLPGRLGIFTTSSQASSSTASTNPQGTEDFRFKSVNP
ncbi:MULTISPECIES: ankyrin repeat domain-containing F-box protein [Legionella]|uniref:Ankyrin repeats (3 copies) n=1 Tax=Legionella drozanskii LLAP-1 TaxID=1212489 RepID=A0A0W0TB90_9GAMM|nr:MULTISPECIES: ankyrin repeat domain-containing F-box protein [Legionella]KTC92859.1 Ankyrin repeats (3 copies) [Legionella drozanskii LLAP-1]PJE05722.1 MAG: ankyrin repeat domain-containing protein [Legionella sp.]